MVFVGSRGFVQYSVDGGTTWKNFGVGTKVTSVSVRNNLERIPVLGTREAAAIVPLKYEGSWSIETYPVDIINMSSELGWDEGVIDPVKFDIRVGVSNGMIRTLNDSIVSRVGISARQGEIIRMTLDGIFRNETVGTDTSGVSFSEGGAPATFANGNVVVDGTTVAAVQSIDMTINVNPNPIFALGSRYFVDAYLRLLEAEGRMTVVMQDTSWINDTENVSEYNTVILELGDAGAISMELAKINELSHSIEPNEIVIADISFYARRVSFVPAGGGGGY